MDKLDFVIVGPEVIKFVFQKQDVEVLPYILESAKLELAKGYLMLLSEIEDSCLAFYGAEASLVLGIMKECTNVKVDENNIESIISSGLWNLVKNKIENYEEFRNDLKQIFENELNKKSFGQAFDKIANGVLEFLDKIGDVDLSPDGVSKLIEGLKSETLKIEEKFPGITTEKATKKPRKKRVKKNKE